MSKEIDNAADPTFAFSTQGSLHINDNAEAPNGDVRSKHISIVRACQEKDVDRLIRLATSEGGLLNDELRRKACEHNVQPDLRLPLAYG
jgi:hypothetical protein